ncbi:response regulator [Sulfitobacter sp. S190]|uniref:response regulator n=1 Tax=Sulfitobacter sp. S190 TaxID=2867022 RepID=UPI0021A37D25|nr:response regulator [Sulfitobacter sp. S190]UWR21934.1 response regulator [Sulfitobacter sp. S190]
MIKLLHVEDDADIREIAKLSLELSGEFEVVQCETGPDALAKVETYTPDIILLDMMMPGMTGKETLQLMRKMESLKDTPAVFMTARAQESELDELRAIGAAEVISKPFDPMSLGEQIKQAMG